ncbi:hypothetical protein [Oceanibaculum indicum]|uniref:Uncharacterized protein n=1 Tax=Oceanibaculum indicum P24 TaxID=1207063 RepID=K2J0Y8_9PROT|nr:hypothetical protein [Oceanibaculum indicum]EKE68713.1 hypothetical protein P24_17267 [Oceanibaculum indicum P24]
MGKAVSLDHAGVYEVIEAYRLPYYLAAAFEAVVCAGRFGVPVRTDLARAVAYLNRMQRCTTPAMKPKPARASVQRRLPPSKVTGLLVGAGKWPGSWQHESERAGIAALLLLSVCQVSVLGNHVTTGPNALLIAAHYLTEIVNAPVQGRAS